MLLLEHSRKVCRKKYLESLKWEFCPFGKAIVAGKKEQMTKLIYIAVTEQE